MKATFRLLLVFIVVFGFWLSLPSRLFFSPSAVSIERYQVTVVRDFPLPRGLGLRGPIISYVETVRPIGNPSDLCVDRNGGGFRYSTENQIGQWNIEDWAAPCMTGGYVWSALWTVKLFGILPLRPVELSLIVREDK